MFPIFRRPNNLNARKLQNWHNYHWSQRVGRKQLIRTGCSTIFRTLKWRRMARKMLFFSTTPMHTLIINLPACNQFESIWTSAVLNYKFASMQEAYFCHSITTTEKPGYRVVTESCTSARFSGSHVRVSFDPLWLNNLRSALYPLFALLQSSRHRILQDDTFGVCVVLTVGMTASRLENSWRAKLGTNKCQQLDF